MKHLQITLAIVAGLSASITLADDFKTIDGKEYKNVTVSRVEPDGIVLKTKSGISKVYFVELPKEIQQQFHYNPENAAAAQAAAVQQAEKNNYEVSLRDVPGPRVHMNMKTYLRRLRARISRKSPSKPRVLEIVLE